MKVKLETLARVAEIAGAIAVVVSVIYLALQISANTKLLRSQAHYNAISLGQRPLELMVENESLAGLVAQCNAAPNDVSAATWERCLNYYLMQFNAWEYFYYQSLDDSIPKELWVGADSYYKSLVKAKLGYRRSWRELQTTFDEPFRSYVADEFHRSSPGPAADN
jgi:hypothetical protein